MREEGSLDGHEVLTSILTKGGMLSEVDQKETIR
jgi:hypothetical protein